MKHPIRMDTDKSTSDRMRRVKLKGGLSESKLAKALWHNGFRYRLNYKKLPGSPDIAIPRYKIAIFVDGEFWHGKDWDSRKLKIKRNREYWIEKIEENISRDFRVDHELISLGWTPMHFWADEITKNIQTCLEVVNDFISPHPC